MAKNKKTVYWIIAAAGVLCVMAVIFFVTDPLALFDQYEVTVTVQQYTNGSDGFDCAYTERLPVRDGASCLVGDKYPSDAPDIKVEIAEIGADTVTVSFDTPLMDPTGRYIRTVELKPEEVSPELLCNYDTGGAYFQFAYRDKTRKMPPAPDAAEPSAGEGASLSPKLDWEIRWNYKELFEKDNDDIPVEDLSVKFMEAYHGAYVVFMDGPYAYLSWICGEEVDGLDFTYASSQKMMVYCRGEFFSLEEAFQYGILTSRDIRDLHEKYTGEYAFLYEP